MLDVPPCTAARSRSSTRAPARAASSAAHPPAMPKPATTHVVRLGVRGQVGGWKHVGERGPLLLLGHQGNLEQVSVSCDSGRRDPDRRRRSRARARERRRVRRRRRPRRRHRLGAEALGPVPGRGVRPAARPRDHRTRRRLPHRPPRVGRRARPAHRERRGREGRRPRARGRDPRPRDSGRQGAAAAAERRRRQPGRLRGPRPATSGCSSPGRRGAGAGTSSAAGSGCRTSSPTPVSGCSRWPWTPTPRTPGPGSRPPRPTYPVAVDPAHVTAERYGITNVPSVVWVDEDDRIVKPPTIAPGDDQFREYTLIDSEQHHDLLRPVGPRGAAARERRHRAPAAHRRRAAGARRAPRRRAPAAPRPHRRRSAHLARAQELAPWDWTVRRGGIAMTGGDPFLGEEFLVVLGGVGRPGAPRLHRDDVGKTAPDRTDRLRSRRPLPPRSA